jgi:DNA-binding MarR family transcriptional regulator
MIEKSRSAASQADGPSVLTLTDAGRTVLANAERFWLGHDVRIMADWTDEEHGEFARLLTRFSAEFND